MNVLFNDLITLRQRSGIGSYAQQLLAHLPRADENLQVVRLSETLAGKPLGWANRRAGAGVGGATSTLKRVAPMLLDVYSRAALRLKRWPLYHEPDGLPLNVNAPVLTTVCDLTVSLFPDWHPGHRVRKYEKYLRSAIERTTHFLAISEATKQDMVSVWGIPPEKITVTLLAARPEFHPVSAAEVRKRFRLPERYLLHLGNLEPRKNVAGLLRAYRALETDIPLVLAGGWGWKTDEIRYLLSKEKRAKVLGYVSDEDLVPLLSGASALVYPSFYEGFGLPPLEAMACEVPVITSNRGSLGEIVGDAALLVEPEDEAGIRDAMKLILENPELADGYRVKGRARVRDFSWEKAARETAAIYRRLLP